jgi:hypothetical protein
VSNIDPSARSLRKKRAVNLTHAARSRPSRDICTTPFKFIVGEGGNEFFIHKGIVSRISKPLSVLVSGPMKEAREGSAVLDDVDDETFARFAYFAFAKS